MQNNAIHGSFGQHNILQVPLTSQVLVQARMKINRTLMQCTKLEDRTDPLYLWTGGSSCPQLSREENTISGTARRREMNPKLLQIRNRPPTVRSINMVQQLCCTKWLPRMSETYHRYHTRRRATPSLNWKNPMVCITGYSPAFAGDWLSWLLISPSLTF